MKLITIISQHVGPRLTYFLMYFATYCPACYKLVFCRNHYIDLAVEISFSTCSLHNQIYNLLEKSISSKAAWKLFILSFFLCKKKKKRLKRKKMYWEIGKTSDIGLPFLRLHFFFGSINWITASNLWTRFFKTQSTSKKVQTNKTKYS